MDARSLIKLTIGSSCVLGSLALAPVITGTGAVLAVALGSVAAGNTANAIDALVDGKRGDRISLENTDLTQAVGKAIAAVITLAAKQHRGKTRSNLEKIAAQAKNNWVKLAQQELAQQRYPELREVKLDQFLTPEEYSLTQAGNLTPQEWEDIFRRLNLAACRGGGFQLPSEVYPQVADFLYTTFPKALRETLKEDFANEGKAFSGFVLQLLAGMKAELAQLRDSNIEANTAELTQILQQFQQLETQLRGTVAQQQAFFRQIAREIDSGFAEVCQQLGVMETTIAGLLQNLEESLERLRQDVAEVRQDLRQGFAEIQAEQRGRQLSRQEFRNRQALLSQMRTEVESRLSQSLHHAILLNVGKEQQPHQVQRPWDVSIKVGEQQAFQLPSETSILEVFENETISGKFLILGKPGSGKTTTLLELARDLVERAETDSDAPIPVILELSEWRKLTKGLFKKEEYDPSIEKWILSQLRSRGVSQQIGEQWIREKELVLLLDGLDELPSERQAKCVRAINQFLESECSPLHLVVCSRKEEYEEYEEVLRLNGAICIEDLNPEQIQNYFASVNLMEFWESIKDSDKIVNFISQPLFLAIASIAYQQIDVEEWRNCNTEQNRIDYLLTIYRLKMLDKKVYSKSYNQKQKPEYLVIRERLILISQYLIKNNNSTELSVYNLQASLLVSRSKQIYKSVLFASLILFCVGIGIKSGLIVESIQVEFDQSTLLINWLSYIFMGCMPFIILDLILYFFRFLNELSIKIKYKTLKKLVIGFFSSSTTIATLLLLFSPIYCSFYLFAFFYLQPYWFGLNMYSTKGVFSGIFISVLFIVYCPAKQGKRDLEQIDFIKICNIKELEINEIISFWTLALALLIQFYVDFSTFFVFLLIFMSLGIIEETVKSTGRNKAQKENLILNTFLWLILFLALGIFLGTIYTFMLDINVAFSNGIVLGLIFGLFAGFALIQYFALRLTLWLTGQMPWNITRFLDYCTECLILQRVGNRYRFIHRLVQEHFANLEIRQE